VQLGLCFKTNSYQGSSAPHPSFYGIVFLSTTDPCDLQAKGYFGADVLFMLPVEAGTLRGREFKTVG